MSPCNFPNLLRPTASDQSEPFQWLENMHDEGDSSSESSQSRVRRFALTALLALFFIYADVLYLGAPFFSFLVCPIISIGLLISLLVQRAGLKNVLLSLVIGPPGLFLMTIVATLGLGELHNHWVLREVRNWGIELRQQKESNGAFPASQKRFIHGNLVVFINDESAGAPVILVDLFDQTRQSYSVTTDRFFED